MELSTMSRGREAHAGLRHDIDFGGHSRCDVLELTLAEVRHCPPGARVDEGEHLLPDVGVGALGNREICGARVEWRVDAGVFEVVAGGIDSRLPGAALIDQGLERGHGVLRLLVRSPALSHRRLRARVLRLH